MAYFCLMLFRFFVLTVLIFITLPLPAQPPALQRNYFRNPLGIPMELAANFGELRPNHWHMGLDIRTNAKENYPVYAAADGYISHIGIRPQSFGRFIIIRHPNGLSTLYAHLNDFFPALEEYVTAKQYEKESWAIELDLTRDQFPVTKGAFIAYSGNTGGSQGPHLHFEVIDTKSDKRLNPLLFDFGIRDDVPPSMVKLAVYDRSKSVYEQTPQFFNLKNTDSGYIIPKIPVINTGLNRLSFAVQTYDRVSGSSNPNGIYSAKLYVDEEPRLSFVLDSIDYDETAYFNAHIDYKMRYNGGAFFEHLSEMPGDKSGVYRKIENDGVVQLSDTSLHAIAIDVSDPAGNVSSLNFFIRYYDSLAVNTVTTNTAQKFVPNMVNVLDKPGFEFYTDEKAMYDTVVPVYYSTATNNPYAFSPLHQAGDASIPLHDDAVVRIKLNKQVPAEWQDKLMIQRSDRKGFNFKKATWQEQWLSAKFSDFGAFQVVADVIPPQINAPWGQTDKDDTVNLSASSRIVFTPADNFGIKKFRVEIYSCPGDTTGYQCPPDSLLTHKWLRFTNDKSRNWIYKFDERCPYGVHHLKVTAEDYAGNVSVKQWWFKRYPYTPPPPRKKKAVKKANEKAKKAAAKKKPAVKKKK